MNLINILSILMIVPVFERTSQQLVVSNEIHIPTN